MIGDQLSLLELIEALIATEEKRPRFEMWKIECDKDKDGNVKWETPLSGSRCRMYHGFPIDVRKQYICMGDSYCMPCPDLCACLERQKVQNDQGDEQP